MQIISMGDALDESTRIMLEWIIGIGAIIGIELLIIIIYTKETIKKLL